MDWGIIAEWFGRLLVLYVFYRGIQWFRSKVRKSIPKSEGGRMKEKITIPVFHEDDMEKLFKSLGIWEDFIAGKMKCLMCKTKLTQDNFGALVPYKNEIYGVCELACISEAQRLVQSSSSSRTDEE